MFSLSHVTHILPIFYVIGIFIKTLIVGLCKTFVTNFKFFSILVLFCFYIKSLISFLVHN